MTFNEIKQLVIAEYNRRKLASDARYRALDDFEYMLKTLYPEVISDVSKFPHKEEMKSAYEEYRNNQDLKMSKGASSMINEVYNQLHIALYHL